MHELGSKYKLKSFRLVRMLNVVAEVEVLLRDGRQPVLLSRRRLQHPSKHQLCQLEGSSLDEVLPGDRLQEDVHLQ